MDNCLPFSLILLEIGTPSHNLVKFLIPSLLFSYSYFPISIFSIHFCLLRKSDINFNGLMAGLVAEILFTDIRLGESIDIINDVFVTTDRKYNF